MGAFVIATLSLAANAVSHVTCLARQAARSYTPAPNTLFPQAPFRCLLAHQRTNKSVPNNGRAYEVVRTLSLPTSNFGPGKEA